MNVHGKKSRRSGMAMIYVIVTMTAMVGFCSLAVDYGRAEAAKTELQTAADAAAMAGAAGLITSNSQAQSQAIAMAANNYVDGTALTLTNSNIKVGIWDTSSHTFSTSGTANNSTTFNAVQVTALRTKANGNPITLMFGTIIGMPSVDVTATSVAELYELPTSTTSYVSSHGDPWLAGQPTGTKGSEADTGYSSSSHPWKQDIADPSKVAAAVTANGSGNNYTAPTDSSKVYSTDYQTGEPYGSPTGFVISVTPGSVINVSIPLTSTNVANNQGLLTSGTGDTYANGDNGGSYTLISDDAANPSDSQGTTTTSGSEHGISNIITPLNSVVGVFMDQNGATYGADSTQETSEANAPGTPSGLDFSTQTERDYTSIAPQLNQAFYIGNGQTSGGISQTIVIPPNTYELFIGTMDGHEWSNNVGGFSSTITQYQILMVQ